MFEPLVGVYRFSECNGEYSSCCTLSIDDETATLRGLCHAITKSEARELESFLRECGVKMARYKRKGEWKKWEIKGACDG